jgi:hypothetical protein
MSFFNNVKLLNFTFLKLLNEKTGQGYCGIHQN